MFNNSAKIFFYMIMMLGIMVTVSANSWLGAWMGLEINLLSFIPLMNDNTNSMSTKASLNYFLTQALASSVLLFVVILIMLKFNFIYQLNLNFNYSTSIILLTLLLKSGTPPLHFWFPKVMDNLSWPNALILMTMQKVAPLMLISYLMLDKVFFIIILLSIIVGSLGGLNQTSLKKIMAFSSINHLGWMFASMMYNEALWLFYFVIYCLLSINMIYFFNIFKIFYINQLFAMFYNSKIMKLMVFINLLSLGGLPPFMGFLPKWMVIQYLAMNNHLFILTAMTVMTLITLFFYLRLCYSSFMLNYYENNWLFDMYYNNLSMTIFSMLSFISTFGLCCVSMLYFVL